MGEEINKFDQISNIYSRFTEENKENLIITAQSLLKIQHDSEEMISQDKPGSGKKRKKKTTTKGVVYEN